MIKRKYFYLVFVICFVFVLSLIGCKNKTGSEDIKLKIIQEIDYLDTKIVGMLNLLNNISLQEYTITSEEISLGKKSTNSNASGSEGQNSGKESANKEGQMETNQPNTQSQSKNENDISITQISTQNVLESDENNIDWGKIKSEIETINEAWAIVVLDLSSLNVEKNNILNFSSILDETILSIKNEDKKNSLKNLARLYSIIPNFGKEVIAENNIQNIKEIKSNIINAYVIVDENTWIEVENNIMEAEKNLKNLISDARYMENKEYKVNKIYVLLKELQNSLSYRDKKLFYVKYKNLMESIELL